MDNFQDIQRYLEIIWRYQYNFCSYLELLSSITQLLPLVTSSYRPYFHYMSAGQYCRQARPSMPGTPSR